MEGEDIYVLKRDDEVLFEGTEDECFGKLHKVQPSSWEHAVTYEGYSVVRKQRMMTNVFMSCTSCDSWEPISESDGYGRCERCQEEQGEIE